MARGKRGDGREERKGGRGKREEERGKREEVVGQCVCVVQDSNNSLLGSACADLVDGPVC